MKSEIELPTAAELISLEVEELENRTAPVSFSYGSLPGDVHPATRRLTAPTQHL